jgi:16S rRNA A1518/A1519 N6-dimethyltransferase RsmA/KsgA/DIM1 with predicted DNA glycosylase/AP lyase activity
MLRGFVENKHIFEEFEFNLSRRAEEVSVSEYINLAKLWAKLEAH